MSDLLLRLLYVAAVDWAALDPLPHVHFEPAHEARSVFEAAALEAGIVSVDEARRVDFEIACFDAAQPWTLRRRIFMQWKGWAPRDTRSLPS